MSLIVQKFGGTSVGDTDRIGMVADKVAGFRAQGHSVVVVVSAMRAGDNRAAQHGAQQARREGQIVYRLTGAHPDG